MRDRTNSEWLMAFRGSPDEAAITDLRATLLRGLRYALVGRGVTESDLEDFTQDALLKVLRELDSFRGDARFTTWAQKVAVRVALTELRRRRWRDVSLHDLLAEHEESDFTPAVLTDKGPDPGQLAVRAMMMEKIQRMIAEELTDKQRLAMMAVMQGGMPLQEVAERMGTNRNAMYKLLHDARQRLQKRMMREGLSTADMLAMFAER
jgi:RNA polymerase sigma-70 factor (ECF subfamily)